MTNELRTQADAARAAIIAKVDRYKAQHSVADSGIGRAALSDSMFVGRLRKGENVTLEKLRRLEIWLDRPVAVSSSSLPAVVSPAA